MPDRILITGCAGSGKSTLARALSHTLNLPVVHLDRHYWRHGWQKPDPAIWAKEVAALAARSQWIMDGNYHGTLEIRLAAADAVIHLDLPTSVCLRRVLYRTVRWQGRTRGDDVPEDCLERWDRAFLSYVWRYRRDQRPRMLSMLREFDGPVLTPTSPGQVRDLSAHLSVTPRGLLGSSG